MADIKLGYGCGIKATLLMPTGVVCDLRDALLVNAVLVLPNGSTMYAKDISADNVTNAIYVRLLADRELTTEGNYSILFNVKLVDGVMYSTVAVNFANVTTNADAEYKEIVLSSNLEVTDYPHNVQRTGASPKISPRQTWLVYNDEAKAYEDTGIPAEVNLGDYYTKEETDAKVAELESEQIYGIGISKSKEGASGASIDIPFIYNVGDTLFWEVEDSIDRVSAISLRRPDGTVFQYGYANTGSIRLEEDGFSVVRAYAAANESANGRKLTIRVQPKEIVDRITDIESDIDGEKVGYTQSNLTDKSRYSMTTGEYLDTTARSYSFAIDSSVKRIVANFDHSHHNFGIILYKADTFVASYNANASVVIDLTNKDVDRAIVQVYSGWAVSFAFYTKIGVKDRVADVESDITMIDSQLDGKAESYNESNLTLRARYSMTDGTLITEESQTHSGFFPIPENVNRIKVAYSPKNANRNWGVILYKGDTFVASYSDDVNFIDLANKDVDKVLIQTYYNAGVSISFIEKEGVVDNVERNTKDIQLLQSVSPQNVKINKIVATRNASDFNSIREIMTNIQDASQSNQYVILIPKGRWFECDLVGKAYVSLVGESREETILYCDGLSNKVTPSDYSFPDYAGMALADIPSSQKHCVRPTANLDIKNCTIEATSCKYSVHIDHWLFTSVNIYNCIVNSINNMLYPIGIGVRGGQSIIVESSIIMYPEMTSSVGFVAHNMADQDEPSILKFNRCYFKNCGFGKFSELGSKQEDVWYLDTCYSDGDKQIEFSESNSMASTPYNIKVNALGSNVAILKKRSDRPNAEQYVIANFDNIQIVA
jgi:hypothetical protein